MEEKLWRPTPLPSLREHDERGKKKHHRQQKQQNPHSGQETQLRHSSKIRGQEREECCRRGDRRDEYARQGRTDDHPDGLLHFRSPVALVHVTSVHHGDEINPQTRQQGSEPRAGLRKLAVDHAGHSEREDQAQSQRRAGVDDGRRPAECVEEQRQYPDDGTDDVDDHVLADETGVARCDLIAAGVLDQRQRRSGRRHLLERLQGVRFDQGAVGQQLFSEWHILRRPSRLGQHQQHGVIGREVITAGGIDVEATSCRGKLTQEDRHQIERIVLDELFEGEGLGSLQERPVARHRFANAGVRKLQADLVNLARREEQQCFRQNQFDEIERIGDLVRDILDARIAAVSGRDAIDQRVILMNVMSSGHLHDDDVVVNRAQVAENLAKVVDLLIVLRDQVEQVGIEGEAERTNRRDRGKQDGRNDDLFVAPQAEAGERVENSVGQISVRSAASGEGGG